MLLKVDCLPNAVGKQPSIPLIYLGRKWTLNWWWWWWWCTWLRFANDAAIVSNNSSDAQSLLNIFVAWCNWANMTIRLDKCCSFGMMKVKGHYEQIQPAIFVNGVKIPQITLGGSFTYLGKIFTFDMNNIWSQTKTDEKITIAFENNIGSENSSPIEVKNFPALYSFTDFAWAETIWFNNIMD